MPPTAHSLLSPSNAKQWMNCTMSVPFIAENADRVPPDTGSRYASEGTEAHSWAERLLNYEIHDCELPEQFNPVMPYVDEVRTLHRRWGGDLEIEKKVILFYRPDDTGTCDAVIVSPARVLVRDLKYGVGVPVDSVENPQLAIYARSLLDELNFIHDFPDDFQLDIRIVQPRIEGDDEREPWLLTWGELKKFTELIGYQAWMIQMAMESGAEFREALKFQPGADTCRWCKAKSFCPSRFKEGAQPLFPDLDVLDLFEDLEVSATAALDTPKIPTLSPAQIVNILRSKDILKGFLSEVESYALEMGLAGTPLPGTKLVAGRKGNREWRPEAEKHLEILGGAQWERTLKSPAQVEKLFKADPNLKDHKSQLDSLVTRADGKPAIALLDDPRPAISAPVELLDVIPDENS